MHCRIDNSKAFVLILLGLSFSCSDSGSQVVDLNTCIEENLILTQNDEAYEVFKRNMTRWMCQGIDHYSYIHVGRSFSGCVESESFIEVSNNQIVKSEIINAGTASDLCELVYATIDQYLQIIQEAVDSSIMIDNPIFIQTTGSPIYVAEKIAIEYSSEFGIPLNGHIDYLLGIADEEFRFEIKDFKVIE